MVTFAEPTPVYEMKVRARRGRWGTAWFKAPRRGLVAVRKSAQPALCATHRAIYVCHEDFDYTLFYLCSSSSTVMAPRHDDGDAYNTRTRTTTTTSAYNREGQSAHLRGWGQGGITTLLLPSISLA